MSPDSYQLSPRDSFKQCTFRYRFYPGPASETEETGQTKWLLSLLEEAAVVVWRRRGGRGVSVGDRGGFGGRGGARGGRRWWPWGSPWRSSRWWQRNEKVVLAARRGGAGAGQRGGAKVIVEPHRHPGVFVVRGGKERWSCHPQHKHLASLSTARSASLSTSLSRTTMAPPTTTKIEYRMWNPFRSKLCAAIAVVLMRSTSSPGSRVSTLVVPPVPQSLTSLTCRSTGYVYAVEFSSRSGRDLITMALQATHRCSHVEDARWRWCLISIKANCIDSTAPAAEVFANEVQKMRAESIKPKFQLTLEPFERDHCLVALSMPRSSLTLGFTLHDHTPFPSSCPRSSSKLQFGIWRGALAMTTDMAFGLSSPLSSDIIVDE
ncbi:hypothetical protein ACKAV7_003167 [Fusarium commune]